MKLDYLKQLEEFTKKLRKIPEILAVVYTGSTAKESWDEYSDIDIDIIVKDKDYNGIVKRLPKLLSMWGKVKLCNHYKGCNETYAFISKDYTKVEIDPIKKSDLKPRWEFKDIRIAFDKDGTITKVFKQSQKEKRPKLDHKEFVHLFLDTRSNLLYVVRHYARGQKLSGASELGGIGGELFYHLGKLKGMEGYENIRTAERHLTKKEWNFLKISSCKSLKKLEVKRAIRANWNYMKYLERLYEKTTKRKLNLKCNDKEILRIINKTLEKAK
jgi:predicted nucleotidyltransferase